MKTAHKLILALFVTALFAVCTTAVYAEDDPLADDQGPRARGRGVELTEEKINEIMTKLEETNPEQAQRLEKLREENPAIFQMQMRRIARGDTANRRKRKTRPGRGEAPGGMMPGMMSMRGERDGRGAEMARQKEAELLEWLGKNDPNKAEELSKLKDDNPRLYIKKMGSIIRKYRRVIEAEKNNPALAAVLKEDIELKGQVSELMRKFRTATDDEKETIRS